MKDKILIVDGNAIVHRAWHALPYLKTKEGVYINAVYGFTSILLKVLKEYYPKYVAIAFDKKGPTFRHKIYKEYKAGRKKKPQEFYDQFDIVKQLLEKYELKFYEIDGFEADDIIGTIAKDRVLKDNKVEPIIITGDMDILQLVDDNIKVYTLKKGISEMVIYDPKAVEHKFELTAHELIEFKALRGDPSDNIKGANGIGEKTALKLIHDFKSIDNLYESLHNHLKELDKESPWHGYKERIKNILIDNEDNVRLSRELVIIKTDVDINFNLEECLFKNKVSADLINFFKEYEFSSLINRLPNNDFKFEPEKSLKQTQLFASSNKSVKEKADAEIEEIDKKEYLKFNYNLVKTEEELIKLIDLLGKQKSFAFDTETTGLDPFNDDLVGISFSFAKESGYYVHFGKGSEIKDYLVDENKKNKLIDLFSNEKIAKYAHNIKFDKKILIKYGIKVVNGIFDTMIASYLLNPGSSAHSLDVLSFNEFGYRKIKIQSLVGKDYKKFAELDGEDIYHYACEDADFCYRLVLRLWPKIKEAGEENLFLNLEMPLVDVLIEMELNGCVIDHEFLNNLSKEYTEKIKELESKIHEIAGVKFNISSPKQLQEVLFQKLEISTKGVKKTKTGYSTSADVLEKIYNEHEIIKYIGQYREHVKLLSTYIDALPQLINSKTKRVHTTFNQTVTSTGRLSSSNPNVQNIPIRTDLGKEIRKAFIVPDGYTFISADYSQVELRVIASLAKDESMITAFNDNEDIHKTTAALVYNVPVENVTKEMRYAAKAINFGVLYGQGARALGNSIGISFKEAKEFIEKYFTVRSSIKKYIEKIKDEAKENGFVTTLYNRRRYIPDINSGIPLIAASAARMAVNTPIQGTAADLIKFAMLKISQFIKDNYKEDEVKMIMQVHDELNFEVRSDLADKFSKELKEIMEKPDELKLDVPIKVDVELGNNWGNLK